MTCVFCQKKCIVNYDTIINKDFYGPFCNVPCSLSYCKYIHGLLGLEQQGKYFKDKYNINITAFKFEEPHLCTIITHRGANHNTLEEKIDLITTESIYDKFLQERIGHNVSSDFFSLDSLIQ